MNFMSDNVAGAAPEIMAALLEANEGTAPSYGADAISKRLEQRFADLFGRTVAVFPVATGTAANALALAQFTPPWGAIYCHAEAHIQADECGAPEMFTGGAKLVPLPGPHGKLSPETLATALDRAPKGFVHAVQPAALSLTQATEAGTVYRPDEVATLAEIAHRHGLSVHMDGARFANAVAHLGCDPADITWRAGVDALSFGATKNGALGAEAVIFFDPAKAADFAYRRKRSAHLFSKMRFLAAQLDAYLADGLWLRLAAHANAMAARLAQGLAALPGVTLSHPVEANEIFAALPEAMITHLQAQGAGFYRWDGQVIRLVTAWNTPAADVERFLALAAAVEK
jgi:threonine aldolase